MSTRTTQLRRYEVADGLMDELIAFVRDEVAPVREQFGMRVEFAYADRENNEFFWAVSVDGDSADFARVDEAYKTSPERAAVFKGKPAFATTQHLSLAEKVM